MPMTTDKPLLLEPLTADIFLAHETKYTQRWDHVEEHDDCYTWECSCGAIEETKFHSWDECHRHTREHWAEVINTWLTSREAVWKEVAAVGHDAHYTLLGLLVTMHTSGENAPDYYDCSYCQFQSPADTVFDLTKAGHQPNCVLARLAAALSKLQAISAPCAEREKQ
jgi:hypothetical protein